MNIDKFIVSARKYRPQNFNTVVGQSHITITLKNAIKNNQLAHAFLFCGPRGVGKTTCARILAKTINCEKITADTEACNKCNSCVSFDNGNSFNIHELDAASHNSVDDIRALVEQVRFAPQAGKYKVYIVDEVHMLSPSAFNAFLKTLEEPPPYTIFILATTEKHKIIPTILSRCQLFDFKRITINDTVTHLQEIAEKEQITAEKSALHLIAQKSEGCMRDSLSILDKIVSFTGGNITYANTLEHLNILDEDYYFSLLDQLQQQQLAESLLLFDEINQKGFEGDTFLDGFAEFLRNLMVCKDPKAAVLLEVAEDFKQKYIQHAAQIDTGWLIAGLHLISDSIIQYKQSRNKKLHVELLLIKLSYLRQAIQMSLQEGTLSQTNITEISKTLSFKSLPIVLSTIKPTAAKKAVKQSSTLHIEAPLAAAIKPLASKIIDTPAPTATPVVLEKQAVQIGSLSKIREQIASRNKTDQTIIQLTESGLQKAWDLFTESLSAKKNHSAATNFKSAQLRVIDDHQFEVLTENNIQQKFIESERAGLIIHLQEYFNNRLLKYQLKLVESNEMSIPIEAPMSKKEQFGKMIEQYPIIQELKEKLNLELEY